jgi:Xaa-Pro aminopeptidase
MKFRSEERRRKLEDRMGEAGVDRFLITHGPHVFYLCGFSGSAGALLLGGRDPTLFTDGRYTVQAREEAGGLAVRITRGRLLPAVGEALRRHSKLRVAFESARLTVAQRAQLGRAAGSRVRWVGVEGWVERLRAVKDEQEIAVLREAAKLASRVLSEIVGFVKPGVRELELAAEIDYRMRRRGASGPAFETIVASGPRAALPHARPSDKRLRRNELVVLDMGAILRHYCSDLTRTVHLGSAPTRVRRWYRAVLEAQAAARGCLCAGAQASAVDREARKVLRRFRLDRAFVHSTGHGVGLEIHEEPRLAREQTGRLEAGNVVTLEPGVYFEGIGGIRVEDDVLVLPHGAETLTTAPRELLEL